MARIVKITAVVGILVLCGSAWAADSNGLVAHWKLDEGSGGTAYDSAGTNDGTLVNGPIWTTGQIDGGLDFDGTNDHVVVADDSSLDISGAISVSAWIKLNDNVNKQIIISKRGSGGWYPYGGYTFHFQNNPSTTGGVFRLLFTKTNGVAGSGGGNHGTHTNWDRVASEKSGNDWQTGVWYHVAATWDGTTEPNSMKIYIDGQLDATHTAKQSFILTNNHVLSIGDILTQMTDPFDGIMDDVRIYNRALSAEEVEELYLMEMSAHERAIIKLEDAAGKKQAALETIEEALDEEWDAYGVLEEMLEGKDYGDLNKRDIIRARQEIHSAMQRQEQAAGALDGSIEGLYDALTALGWEPTDPNLIAHWKLDEESGTIAYDSAGSNHGTLVNGPAWTTGQIDGALDFDGSNDYVNSGSTFPSVAGSTTKTITAWAKSDTADYSGQDGEAGRIVTLYREPGNTAFSILARGNPATWRFIYRRSPNNVGWLDSEVTVTADQWLHIALVQNDSNVSCYVNGAEANSVNDAIAPAISNPTNADIGVYWNGYGAFFDGTIDDVRIYDKALSAEEILQLYQDGL